jgi:hypothetical protein
MSANPSVWTFASEATLLEALEARHTSIAELEQEADAIHAEMLLRLLSSKSVRYLEVAMGLTGDDGAQLLCVTALLNARGEEQPLPSRRDLSFPNQDAWRPAGVINRYLISQAVRLNEHAVSRALQHLLGPTAPTGFDHGLYVGEGSGERGYYDLVEHEGLTADQYTSRVAGAEVAAC